jgi:hypothetical protein
VDELLSDADAASERAAREREGEWRPVQRKNQKKSSEIKKSFKQMHK